MLLLTLLACGGDAGTWLFTLDYVEPDGTECALTPTHNFLGAYTPPVAADDLSWSAEQTESYSPSLFFARVEETADGAVLVIGDTAIPGTITKGIWNFAWTRTTTGTEQYTHVTGYSFDHAYEDSVTVRIEGSVTKGAFAGTYTNEYAYADAYTESDTWSDEAAAYVGTNGLTPVGNYLLKLDSTGVEVAASNTQAAYDCSSASCTLTIQEGCSYGYDLSATPTELTPDDAGWAEDATQPYGAG